ncbi:hypothetical protein M422DRAFT_25537 [Sphaerobolus stellatus SS14]|nr:hypothetical protein M422DRAFT_25537 [Sphaerobolus stellatus SS14]
MSADLQWLLLRKNNSYIVKQVPEGPIFSREAGNLPNLHSFKYSGAANYQTIGVQDTPNGIQITSRRAKASPQAVSSALATTTISANSSARRSYGVVAGLAKRHYRPDLRKAAVARVSALLAARKNAVKVQPVREKKIRGSKKAKAVKTD